MSAKEIGSQFVNHYYNTFDNNRAQLANLYQPVSTMTWEGNELSGQQAIMQKLGSLPTMKHMVTTMDVQAISNNAMIVYVTGKLSIDNGNPLLFGQVFQLAQHQPQAYYVHNDLFRLSYG